MELDFLRLAYAVREFRCAGVGAQGYLLVMTQSLVSTVRQWIDKYATGDSVIVCCPTLSVEQEQALMREKAENIQGMLAGTLGEPVYGRSSARIGREIGEAALREVIRRYEPDVTEVFDKEEFPLGVSWDFYGLVLAEGDFGV